MNADGWHSYGLVKSSYVLLAGSVPGSRKRLVRIRNAIRDSKGTVKEPQVVSVYVK
ncbi:MAG: 50S ribosomal protein L3 [Candidatus Aenigmarchaeota archaeon]|nr:50S ribosomal protein L3 [Candidatus Aenigmarchaeota archaeon]